MSEQTNSFQLKFEEQHFLGRLSEELSDLIAKQSADLFTREGIVIPPKSCSLMLSVETAKLASARDLAAALSRSHQLISQKLPKLLKLNLLDASGDPHDARQRLYSLTDYGKDQLAKFKRLQSQLEQSYQFLSEETGDVGHHLRLAIAALKASPLTHRVDRLQ